MQREIKFRAKLVDNGNWVYGCLLKRWVGTQYKHYIVDGLYEHEVIPETVCQYTGLKDWNGKEIYEGDTVRSNNNDVDLCQVCQGEFPVYVLETEEVTDIAYGWYLKVTTTDELSKLEPFCYDRVINRQWIGTLEIEVVGNIYDNPELLNQPSTDTP